MHRFDLLCMQMFALLPLLSASFQSPIASILLRLHPDSMKQSLPNCQSFRACLSGWNSHFSACVFMGLCEEWNLNVNSVLMGIRHTLKIVSKNVAWKWFQMSLSYFKLASIGNALCVNRTINCVTRVIKAERERWRVGDSLSVNIEKVTSLRRTSLRWFQVMPNMKSDIRISRRN